MNTNNDLDDDFKFDTDCDELDVSDKPKGIYSDQQAN